MSDDIPDDLKGKFLQSSQMKKCSSCGKKGMMYTATYFVRTLNGSQNYSHILCIECAKDAKQYGITIHPEIKDN